MRVASVLGQCEAHGQCAIVNAELFVLDEEGYTAIDSAGIEVPADMEQIARRGVEACPLQALHIVEELLKPQHRRRAASVEPTHWSWPPTAHWTW